MPRDVAANWIILGLPAAILVELCLSGTQGIPFACAYVPGRSRSHVSTPIAMVMLLLLSLVVADFERRALLDATRYAAAVGLLALVWIAARWTTSSLAQAITEPEFESEPSQGELALNVWDSRVTSRTGD